MKNELIVKDAKPKLDLTPLTPQTTSTLAALTSALGVPRDVLASDDEIAHAVAELPRLIERIPQQLRGVLHVRMCVAVVTGLFDAAVNYAWNSAMIELREKVRRFGIHVVPQIIDKDFGEADLIDLKDAELVSLCLSLNLLTEEGYFFLDQCREVRNSFSAAHPPSGNLDDQEFLTFLNRCAKYALNDAKNPRGVDTRAFLKALKAGKFAELQQAEWVRRMDDTHEAQRNLLIGMLHGVYCDPDSPQDARLNAIGICKHFADRFSAKLCSDLINRHSNYIAEDKADRQKASRIFFQEVGHFNLLSETERHAIVSAACRRMMSVHLDWNNFHNEPAWAARLWELSQQAAIPLSAQPEFVQTVVTCGAGNTYGVSNGALPDYQAMVKAFSPREVNLMLEAPNVKDSYLQRRLNRSQHTKQCFKALVALLDAGSVPPAALKAYKKWMA
jgi:hypothetical protein